MKGVAHYLKDGTLYKGESHKMPNGEVHTGKTHDKSSEKLFHFDELGKEAQKKAAKSKEEKPKGEKGTAVVVSFMDAVEKRMKDK